ncbi:MAG: hypothetical protein PHW31_04480 [Candidatus Pacebacteria bacterium]|nr:hypothetical protein [Candidatus Paceibacterota bacterium]
MKSYKASRFQRKNAAKKKIIKRRRLLRSKAFWDFILAIVFIVVLGYWLFFSPILKIKDIQVISVPEIPAESIKQIVNQELNKKWLIIEKNSFFLADIKTIKNRIMLDFPLTGEVKIKRGLPGSIFIEIKPRITQSAWCFALSTSTCFLADQQRIIFTKATQEDLQSGLTIIFSEQPQKEVFSEVCSKSLMDRIDEIKKMLSEKFGIDNLSFTEKANGFLNVMVFDPVRSFASNGAGGWEIYFDPKNDLSVDLTKLRLLLDKEITPEQRKNLQYIDLRFSKAYYK